MKIVLALVVAPPNASISRFAPSEAASRDSADAPAFKWIGSGVAAGSVIAYLALSTAFGGEAFRLVGALGIIALGLALTIGGLADRLSRKSPA